MKSRSLREKLLVAMFGVVLFLFTTLSIAHVAIQKKILEEELSRKSKLIKKTMETRSSTLSNYLKYNIENSIAAYDFFGMAQEIEKMVRDEEELDYARLMDNEGGVHVNAGKNQWEKKSLELALSRFKASPSTYSAHEIEENGKSYLECVIPIHLGDTPWGALYLGFSLENLAKEIKESEEHMRLHSWEYAKLSFIFSGLCLLIGAGVVYFGGRRITDPLKDLTEFSKKLSQGELHPEILEKRARVNDEIGILSGAFIEMATKVSDSRLQLLEYSHALERKVDERTAELQNAFERIHNAHEKLQLSQDQLIQAEKMASLGQLVAGVAHEINTPIGVGVTASSFLQEQLEILKARLPEGTIHKAEVDTVLSRIQESSALIFSNLQRASELVVSFKQTSADQTSQEKRKFNLRHVLSDTLNTLKPSLKRTQVMVSLDCPENLEINSFPGSISQVVTNLVMNSLDHAFEEDGEGGVAIDVKEIADDRIEIFFSDNGKGIPQEMRKRIFDPFVTTRRGQGGTGLGLYIVLNVVRDILRGTIECISPKGKGAMFTIIFPKNL